MKFQVFGATSPEESLREKEHKALSRRAAAEGIVLLKNDGILPLQTRKIALYGPGSRMTVKGGSGRKGSPKPMEKVAWGSTMPSSVPATLLV